MSQPAARTPNWDMTPYFPEFEGPDYRAFRKSLEGDLESLAGEVEGLGQLEAANLGAWSDFLRRLEDATARAAHLASYLGCLGAADALDERIQRETASLAVTRAELEKLLVGVRAALREATADQFAALVAREELRPVAWSLERLRQRATWSMEPELERLAADLGTTGITAWGRLYDQVSGKLAFDHRVPGEPPRRLPVSMTRTLLEDADPAVRQAALQGSNAAWKGMGDVVAACLNAIAGTRLALYARRGVTDFLDPALFDASITRRTLDTLLRVVTERQEVPRRYLRRKARILGLDRLGFQDLMAPLPLEGHRRVSWPDARQRILEAFGRFHPELRRFAELVFERNWIDWEPRSGKRPGGFCSSSAVIGESRIFMTYHGALGDVGTLAHELGHAFHAWLMRDMRPWARRYPMTLAETASTFAEQLVIDAVLGNPAAAARDRAALLDGRMQDAVTFLLNIPMRFHFENAVYQERAAGELPLSRLRELMLAAQRRCYGDTLAEDQLDPWFWASKLHFYITGVSFYNFPYTFGYLFSLGIFARARQEGPEFLERYRELLRLTGSASAEEVALRSLGVDLAQPEFWHASIDLVEADLDRFFEAADALFPERTSG